MFSFLLGDRCKHGRWIRWKTCDICKRDSDQAREQRQRRWKREQIEKRNKEILAEIESLEQAKQKLNQLDNIKRLSGVAFEHLILEIYSSCGFSAESTPLTNDGGIDGILRKDSRVVVLQCKNWKGSKVGSPQLRDFLGAIIASKADSGIMCTTNDFTNDAIKWAADKPIELINGDKVLQMIGAHLEKGGKVPPAVAKSFAQAEQHAALKVKIDLLLTEPCKKCGSPVVLRKSRFGPFLGCSAYPKCKSIVRL